MSNEIYISQIRFSPEIKKKFMKTRFIVHLYRERDITKLIGTELYDCYVGKTKSENKSI